MNFEMNRTRKSRRRWTRQQMMSYIIEHNSLYLMVNLSVHAKYSLKKIIRRIERAKKKQKRAA
jgi:hypothetical protein